MCNLIIASISIIIILSTIEHNIILNTTEIRWCLIKPKKFSKKSRMRIKGKGVTVFCNNGEYLRPVFQEIPRIKMALIDLIIVLGMVIT